MATNRGFYNTAGSLNPIPAPPIDYTLALSVGYTHHKKETLEIRNIFQSNIGSYPYIMVGYRYESLTAGVSEMWVKSFQTFSSLLNTELLSFFKACYRSFEEDAIISFITRSVIIDNNIGKLVIVISKELSLEANRQLQDLLKFYVKGLKIKEGKNV